jgi:hypothetical protein
MFTVREAGGTAAGDDDVMENPNMDQTQSVA